MHFQHISDQSCGRLISKCVMQAPINSENDCSRNLLEPLKVSKEDGGKIPYYNLRIWIFNLFSVSYYLYFTTVAR